MYFRIAWLPLLLSLHCFISIPYPACYYFEQKKDLGTVVEISFRKNDFYGECTGEKGKLIDAKKDLRILFDGLEKRLIKVVEICPEEF